MQNFGVTNKEHYGMLWYFLAWSIGFVWPSEPRDSLSRLQGKGSSVKLADVNQVLRNK